jgi:hypothetical protein
VVRLVTELMARGTVTKSFTEFAFDLAEISFQLPQKKLEFLLLAPQKYVKGTSNLALTLSAMRSSSLLFISTNESAAYVECVLGAVLGPDYLSFFDLIITSCRKPLFHLSRQKFIGKH